MTPRQRRSITSSRPPEQPDVRSNVERIWSSDQRRDFLIEADWFEKQTRYYLLVNEVLCRAIQRLAHDKISVRGERTDDEIQRWACGTDIGFSPELVSSILRERLFLGQEIPGPPGYQKSSFNSMDTAALGVRVEEVRKRLRRLMDRERVLAVIARCLMHRQFIDRKALDQPLGDFLHKAIEDRMYRRELNTKRIQAIIEEEVERVLPLADR